MIRGLYEWLNLRPAHTGEHMNMSDKAVCQMHVQSAATNQPAICQMPLRRELLQTLGIDYLVLFAFLQPIASIQWSTQRTILWQESALDGHICQTLPFYLCFLYSIILLFDYLTYKYYFTL